jgi:DNA-directed RNA polymerase specialized sigma24 family protein
MSMSEIADVVGIAPGTVASRLRKARQLFESAVARLGRAAPRAVPARGERAP